MNKLSIWIAALALWGTALAETPWDFAADPMGDNCLTCWRQPPGEVIVSPYGTWTTYSDPEPPVINYDMGGRRAERERVKEEGWVP